jgi:hypothetical protein
MVGDSSGQEKVCKSSSRNGTEIYIGVDKFIGRP